MLRHRDQSKTLAAATAPPHPVQASRSAPWLYRRVPIWHIPAASILLTVEGNDDQRPDDSATPARTRILAAAIGLARRIAQADSSVAQLLDAATGELLTVAQQGVSSTFLDYFEIVNDGESACAAVLR